MKIICVKCLRKASVQNAFMLLKQNFRLAIVKPAFLAICYLLFLPAIHGITNLDRVHAAEILEKFVSLAGTILFVPICRPEQDIRVKEAVFARPYSYMKVVGIRLALATLAAGCMVSVFSMVLLRGGCDFPAIQYTLGAWATALALGSIGNMAAVLGNNSIAGYLASSGVLILNWTGIVRRPNPAYLFSMMDGQPWEKWRLLLAAAAGMAVTVRYLRKINRNFERQLV